MQYTGKPVELMPATTDSEDTFTVKIGTTVSLRGIPGSGSDGRGQNIEICLHGILVISFSGNLHIGQAVIEIHCSGRL